MKTLTVAVAGIVLGFGAVFAGIAVVTAPPAQPAASTATPAAPELSAEPPALAVDASALATATQLAQAPLPAAAPPPGGGARELRLPASIPTPRPRTRPAWLVGSTQRLAPRNDPTPLGPLRPYVAAGMSRLQLAVATCADDAPPGGVAAAGRRGRVTLTVKLEAFDNEVRIVDAALSDGAAADDWRVRCALGKLRGQRIHAPARAGPRFEIPFVLSL